MLAFSFSSFCLSVTTWFACGGGRAGGRADRETVRRTAQRGSTRAGGGGGAHRPLLLLDLLGLRLLHLGDCEARGRRGRGCERARAAGSRRRSGRNGMEPRYRSVWPSAAHGAGERQVSGRERRVTTAGQRVRTSNLCSISPCWATAACACCIGATRRCIVCMAGSRGCWCRARWREACRRCAGGLGWLVVDGCCVLRRRYRYRCGTRICFKGLPLYK